MFTRKIGKLLRGNATPKQIGLACLIGTLFGFTPFTLQTAGMLVLLVLCFLVLNTNFFLTVLTSGIAKGLAIPLSSVSFWMGTLLLDGPLQFLFEFLVNAPGTALLGLEYYQLTGGLVVGAFVAGIEALLLIKTLRAFRSRMASLETESETFREWNEKWWVRLLKWVFLGSGPGVEYEELLEKKGRFYRVSGLFAGFLLLAAIGGVQYFFGGQIVTMGLKSGLETANGSTVNVGSANPNLQQGKLVIQDLAISDSSDLDRNLFEAKEVDIDISSSDLLRRRLTLDRVAIKGGAQGTKRSTKAERFAPTSDVSPTETEKEKKKSKSLDHYLSSADQWKERLRQASRYLEKMGTSKKKPRKAPMKRGKEIGFSRVSAQHLIHDIPTFTVREFHADEIDVRKLKNETIDVSAQNLSTHPNLLKDPTSVRIRSSEETITMDLDIDQTAERDNTGKIDLKVKDLDGDRVGKMLSSANQTPPVQGGTVSARLNGTFQMTPRIQLDNTLLVHLKNTTVQVAGRSQKVKNLQIPVGIRGPLAEPRIMLDYGKLVKALSKAGAGALAEKLAGKENLNLKKLDLGDGKDGALDKGKKAIKGLFGGGDDEDD